MSKHGVKMCGIGVALPSHEVRNDDLTALVETSDEWITTRTGFKARRVVAHDELMTDFAIAAAKNALEFAGMKGEDIDLIILASSTPDYIYPAGCGVVQQGIGASRAFGFDVAMGCSGLIYAMGIAIQFLENGTAKNALVIGSDCHSRYTDWYDRNTCVLFGDGAGAYVLRATENPADTDVLAVDFMLDGGRGQEIKLPINRDNCPLAPPRTFQEKSAVYMNGREVFKFAVGDVPKLIEASLEKAGIGTRDVDYYVLHQANARIMSSMSERMDITPEQMIVNLENYGNTSAASIPLAMMDAINDKQIIPGQTLVLCGFGAGLATATVVMKWNAVDHRPASAETATHHEPVQQN